MGGAKDVFAESFTTDGVVGSGGGGGMQREAVCSGAESFGSWVRLAASLNLGEQDDVVLAVVLRTFGTIRVVEEELLHRLAFAG
jgi:hypothetical protein